MLAYEHFSPLPEKLLTPNWVELPKTFEQEITKWPELIPLLVGLAQRDGATFMHSMAVHYTASTLSRDLLLRLQPTNIHEPRIWNRAPFWLLHDIGKVAADRDEVTAQSIVHPAHNADRSSYEMARHWVHPVMGATIISNWAETASPQIQPYAETWAQLTQAHHNNLVPYITGKPSENIPSCLELARNWFDFFALFAFKVSDTAIAMGLPRPHREQVYPDAEILRVLDTHHLPDQVLDLLSPTDAKPELRKYILASVHDSLNHLAKRYTPTQWLQPEGFANPMFRNSAKYRNGEAQTVEILVARSWTEHENWWASVMISMDIDGVFSRAK